MITLEEHHADMRQPKPAGMSAAEYEKVLLEKHADYLRQRARHMAEIAARSYFKIAHGRGEAITALWHAGNIVALAEMREGMKRRGHSDHAVATVMAEYGRRFEELMAAGPPPLSAKHIVS